MNSLWTRPVTITMNIQKHCIYTVRAQYKQIEGLENTDNYYLQILNFHWS